jgi:hypothetical protein
MGHLARIAKRGLEMACEAKKALGAGDGGVLVLDRAGGASMSRSDLKRRMFD